MVAETLEQSLGPQSNFHERAQGVGDAAQVRPKRRAAFYEIRKKNPGRPVAP